MPQDPNTLSAAMKPFIGYHFFHGVGRIPPREAYIRTQHAMSMFTNQKAPSHHGFILNMYGYQGSPLESLFQELCARFGPVTNSMTAVSGGWGANCNFWVLESRQFEESFPLLETIQRQFGLEQNRALVQAVWNFKFVDPETGALLPNQESLPEVDMRIGPGSSLVQAMGNKTSANAWFLFPFETATRDFESYACRFQKELIFNFLPKHWRLWKHYPVRGWWPKKIVPSWYANSAVS